MKVHILILNFNGAELLEKYLHSFVSAAKRSAHSCRVSVVDNVSRDNSRVVVERLGGAVAWIPMRENQVLCSYNDAAAALDDDILILMNNDVELPADFVDPLIDPFQKDVNLFMTSPAFYSIDKKTLECGRAGGGIRWGLFWSKAMPSAQNSPGIVASFSSGMGAVDRKKFLALGGYDPLYLPGTLEDVDLCFRAWQGGWRILHVPASRVYHVGQVSFKKHFGARGLRIINFRNVFLFMWKNISDPLYFMEHLLFLFPRIAWALLKGQPELGIGFVRALALLPRALSRRRREKPAVSDRQIFSLFHEAGVYS